MGTPIGNLGGIALQPEVDYGAVAGAGWVWQHPMPSTLGFRRTVIEPNLLSYAAQTARGYSGKYVDGDLVVGLSQTADVIDPVYGLFGNYSENGTAQYSMGGGVAPDYNSLSALMNYDGGGATPEDAHEWIHKGVKGNALRLAIEADSNSSATIVGIGQDTEKTPAGSALTPAPPAETDVVMPSFIGTVNIGAEEICLYSATIEVLTPKTGADRKCLGGLMREPITNGRPDVTFSLNCSLDDGASNDSITALGNFLAGLTLGNITLGTGLQLVNCFMAGDFPPLQDGEIDFTIQGWASSLVATVTAKTP